MVTEATAAHGEKSAGILIGLMFVLMYLPFLYFFGFKYIALHHVDFPSFYWGARVAFDSHLSPYGPSAFAPAQAQLDQIVYPYLYPPPSLLLFYPFSLFKYGVAKVLMLVLNQAVFLYLGYMLLFKLKLLNISLKSAVGTAALLFFGVYLLEFHPVITNMNHGQINLIVLSLVLTSWYSLKNERSAAAIGVPLAFAILLKTYPVVFMPLLFFRKRYRALAWTVGTVAAATVLAYFVLPKEVWSDWFYRVLPTGGYGQIPWGLFTPAPPQNQSFNGFAFRLFSDNEFAPFIYNSPLLLKLTAYALCGAVAAATVGLTYRATRIAPDNKELIDMEFALTLVMMFLIGPLSWEHHIVYALPAIFLVMYRLLTLGRVYTLAFIALPSALVLAWNLPFVFNHLANYPLAAVLMMSLKLYALITLWLLGAAILYRRTRAIARSGERGERAAAIPADAHNVLRL